MLKNKQKSYKQLKQPNDLLKPNELNILSIYEKELYMDKLKMEIYEYQSRETIYS